MNLKSRLFGTSVHLGISLLIVALVWFVVFKFFYPYPFIEISGGRHLFLLIVAVYVILGPLLTFAVLNPLKSRRVLTRDLMVIVALQMTALAYGLWTVYLARPVYLVYEVDRFKVVSAVDVDASDLAEAPVEFRRLPWSGVHTIGIRAARSDTDKLHSLELELAGKELSLQTGWWQPLSDDNRVSIRQHGKPVALLRQRTSDGGEDLNEILFAAGLRDGDVIALPLLARFASWSVLLDKRNLRMVGYLPVDLFSEVGI